MAMLDPRPSSPPVRMAAAYLAMVVGTVALFLVVRAIGATLTAPAPAGPAHFGVKAAASNAHVLMHVLLALFTILVSCRVMGRIFRALQQPPVIGEVLAGILLGPSLLGRIAPDIAAYLLPLSVAPMLGVIAQIGVILYMFTVGLELDAGLLKGRSHAAVAISHASILTPFVLGELLALWLYPRLSTRDVPFTAFALFMGVAMSVTAFPVLARILTDRGMSRSDLGVMALTCAAVDDVTAWCLLALVVGVAQAKVGEAVWVILGALGYMVLVLLLAKPLARRLARFDPREELSQGTIATVMAALLLSSWLTEFLGIHAVFGAFLLGAVIPHDSIVARQVGQKLRDIVAVLFLPAFFAYTGMRTQIGLVAGPWQWLVCAVIIVVATTGKFGGTLGAARLSGIGWRDAAALGILMNTRGLMELIVLNIGLDLKVISPTLFAMMVLMALATTIATTPILQRLHPQPSETSATPSAADGRAIAVSNPIADG
jgi:Kef-type K+ transport system membrane component KefB